MGVEELNIERITVVDGGVLSDCDIPEMKYFLVVYLVELREMVI